MPLVFPDHGDPNFAAKLASLAEYQMFKVPLLKPLSSQTDFEKQVDASCGMFEKATYQHLIQHYLSKRSPYRSILLYHGLGVGKTCSSITVAESFLLDHTANMPPKILVVAPATLRKSYEEQVFSIAKYLNKNKQDLENQCTADTYKKLIHGKPDDDVFARRLQQLIRSRYEFISYDGVINYLAEHKQVTDKVIIVDEAHNLRQTQTEKKAAEALEQLLESGARNRLILLSATPMYNEPEEIFWLLGLLLRNDHRTDMLQQIPKSLFRTGTAAEMTKEAHDLLKSLSSEYVSYIRGKNPFTFAARITPAQCDVPVLQEEWAKVIPEGIVPSIAGAKQQVASMEKELKEEDGSMPKQLQWLNITYPKKTHGSTGFWEMFAKRSDDKKDTMFPATYKLPYKDALMPVPGKLSTYAAKMQTIMNCIQQSEGIVVVYSQYVWSGVLPLAVALEHAGFTRYDGTGIVANPKQIDKPYRYVGIESPHYCILSGDKDVMGSSRIDKLLRVINNPDNLRGRKIKVVLITPIAGEGLSFQNVRSVHIMDPWYHMNLIEQVIGRAIRTCSHVRLPLEERNVTVFLHACVATQTTADIHAYKIAARKLLQSKKVEEIIRDNAMDCSLLYQLNYYPKELFKFNIMMRTSQGTLVPFVYGDDSMDAPKCVASSNKANTDTLRSEVYGNIAPTIIRRMQKYVKSKLPKTIYFSSRELVEAAKMPEDVVKKVLQDVLYPNQWMEGYRFHAHLDGYVFVPITKPAVPKELILPSPVETRRYACDIDVLLNIPTTNEDVATILAYNAIDSLCWKDMAEHVIDAKELHQHPIVRILAKHGLFIRREELNMPRFRGVESAWLGYVDVFQKGNFTVWLKDPNEGWREATDQEVKQIQAARQNWKVNEKEFYGLLEPTKFSKDNTQPLRHQLKLFFPEPSGGKKRGVVCTSNKKPVLIKALQEGLGQTNIHDGDTKDQLCFTIATELLKNNKLQIYPLWKPKVVGI